MCRMRVTNCSVVEWRFQRGWVPHFRGRKSQESPLAVSLPETLHAHKRDALSDKNHPPQKNIDLLMNKFLITQERSESPHSFLFFVKEMSKNIPFGAGTMLRVVALKTGKPVGGPSGLGRGNLIPAINMGGGRCTLSGEDTKWGRQRYSDVVDTSVRTAGSSFKGITGIVPPSACGQFISSMMSSLVSQYRAL